MDDDWGARASRWAHVRTQWVDVQGTSVRTLRVDGDSDGVPQLLVHGLGGSATDWLEVMTELARLGPVVAPDLPGFGQTRPPTPRAARVRPQARFLPALCAQLGLDRVVVHGNSMGGLIGVIVAAQQPGLVERLVLVDAALPPLRAHTHRIHPRTLARFLPFSLPGVGLRILSKLWDRYTPEQLWANSRGYIHAVPDRISTEIAEVGLANLVDGQQVDWRLPSLTAAAESLVGVVIAPRRLLKDVERVSAPTLALWGDADQLVGRATLELIEARRPDWDVRVLTGVGHCPHLETPDDYLKIVADWFDGPHTTTATNVG